MAKYRVLYYSSKGKIVTLSEKLAGELGCRVDKIPPSYNCDNEKLVFIGVSTGKELPDQFSLFCRGLSKERCRNVAFFVDGPQEAADKLIALTKAAGTNPIENVKFIDGGMKFFSKAKDEDIADIIKWAKEIEATVN